MLEYAVIISGGRLAHLEEVGVAPGSSKMLLALVSVRAYWTATVIHYLRRPLFSLQIEMYPNQQFALVLCAVFA